MKQQLFGLLALLFLPSNPAVALPPTSQDNIDNLEPGKGIVIGTFSVKGKKHRFLNNYHTLKARRDKRLKDYYQLPGFVIETQTGENEALFAEVLPSGNYHFYELISPGGTAKIRLPFKVTPGTTTYIGQIILTLKGNKFLLAQSMQHGPPIEAINKKYGIKLGKVIRADLVAISSDPAVNARRKFELEMLEKCLDREEAEVSAKNKDFTKDMVRTTARMICKIHTNTCEQDPDSDECIAMYKKYKIKNRPPPAIKPPKIYMAADDRNINLIKKLIKSGANVNEPLMVDRAGIRGEVGWTALMIASAKNYDDVVAILLKAGADPAIKTKKGETAYSIARSFESKEVLKLLENLH